MSASFVQTVPQSAPPPPDTNLPESQVATLRVFTKGFLPNERRLLEGTVMLSRRRNPRLELLKEADAGSADVFMIDANDRESVAWANGRPWLKDRTVIWVDTMLEKVGVGHIAVKRPVQWPILPMLLARALEQDVRRIRRRRRVDGKGFASSTFGRSTFESTFGPSEFLASAFAEPGAEKSAQPKERIYRVLVVDDSLAVRSHLVSILGKHGLTVTQADSGEAGLNAVSAITFDCILMDVMMPGMDGYEACRRIKATATHGKRAPAIVMLTSKSSPFDHIRGKMAGCDAYLTKPVDIKKLMDTLRIFVRLKAVESGAPPVAAAPTPAAQPQPSPSNRFW